MQDTELQEQEIDWAQLELERQAKMRELGLTSNPAQGLPVRLVVSTDVMPIQRLPQSTITSLSETIEEPTCQTCWDMGWVRVNPYTLPGQEGFGKITACPACLAPKLEAKRQEELVKLSGMENFAEMTFGNFATDIEGVAKAVAASSEFARHPQGWLVLKGDYGCGKTHLAAAIANVIKSGLYFAVVPDLLDYLRAAFDPNREINDTSYLERFELIKNIGLLILDDLGTENQTPWVRQAMFQLINHRYTRRLPTVITTNDFSKSEPRVIDRICDRGLSRLIEMTASSYRLRGKR